LTDSSRMIRSVSPPAKKVAEYLGLRLEAGMRADQKQIQSITDAMAAILAGLLFDSLRQPMTEALLTPGSSPIPALIPADRVFLSGGVASCIRMQEEGQSDDFAFGDIGMLLARSLLNNQVFREKQNRIHLGETIRATVIGAGTYTTSLSGSTIYCTDGLLPVKNLPVCHLSDREQKECLSGNESGLKAKLSSTLEQTGTEQLLLTYPGLADPTYSEIRRLAETFYHCLDSVLPAGAPVMLAAESDMAKAMGYALQNHARGSRGIVSIDSICTQEHDYVDIGKPLFGGLVVPVIIKTLLFG